MGGSRKQYVSTAGDSGVQHMNNTLPRRQAGSNVCARLCLHVQSVSKYVQQEKKRRESDKEVAEVVLGVDEVPSLSGGLGRRGCYRLN